MKLNQHFKPATACGWIILEADELPQEDRGGAGANLIGQEGGAYSQSQA